MHLVPIHLIVAQAEGMHEYQVLVMVVSDSHVMLPRRYEADNVVHYRYTLFEDFMFVSVPIGDKIC